MKNCIWKCCLFVVCWIFLQTFQTYFCIQANNVDPKGAVWSHYLQKWLLKSQADDKADDKSCDRLKRLKRVKGLKSLFYYQ